MCGECEFKSILLQAVGLNLILLIDVGLRTTVPVDLVWNRAWNLLSTYHALTAVPFKTYPMQFSNFCSITCTVCLCDHIQSIFCINHNRDELHGYD